MRRGPSILRPYPGGMVQRQIMQGRKGLPEISNRDNSWGKRKSNDAVAGIDLSYRDNNIAHIAITFKPF